MGSKLGKKAFVIMVAATVVFSSLIGVIAQVQGSVSPTQAVDGDETSLYNPTCYIDFTDDGFASYGYHDYDFKEEHTFWEGPVPLMAARRATKLSRTRPTRR